MSTEKSLPAVTPVLDGILRIDTRIRYGARGNLMVT
jgi:hypothetical protein